MFVKWKAMTSIKWVNYMLVTTLVASFIFMPTARGLSTLDERAPRKLFGGYRITPKFCRASKTLPPSDPRSKGPTICMFNHECAQRNGEVVGACMDGFLFGACCQIPGEVESSLLHLAQTPQISSNLAAAMSYENYGSHQSTTDSRESLAPLDNIDQGSAGSYYELTGSGIENEANQGEYIPDSNAVQEDHKTNQFYVNHDSVVISSPSSLHASSISSTPSSIESTNQGGNYDYSNYSPELPAQISIQQFSSSHYKDDISTSEATQFLNLHKNPSAINDEDGEFSHSDITHPGADSELIEDDVQLSTGYSPSTIYVPSPTKQTETSSISVASSTQLHKKPSFKPKPTVQTSQLQNNAENYVLVQTISNDKTQFKPPIEGITTSDIESIESIILMLNDSNHGPAYNTENASPDPNRLVYTSVSTKKPVISTNSGAGGFYITTIPSTNIRTSTRKPVIIKQPTGSTQSSSYGNFAVTTPFPTKPNFPSTYPVSTSRPTVLVTSSTNKPSTQFVSSSTTKRPGNSKRPVKPGKPAQPAHNNEVIITPTRRPSTPRPTKTPQPPSYSYVVIPTKPVPSFIIKKTRPTQSTSGTKITKPKLPSTSYVTGPTTPRPRPSTPIFSGSSTEASLVKVQESTYSSTTYAPVSSSYGSTLEYLSSTQKVPLQQASVSRPHQPEYIKIPATQRPPSPTVIITPKPTPNLATSSSWTKIPTPASSGAIDGIKLPTSSYIDSPTGPQSESSGPAGTTQSYLGLPTVVSNDFDDPGYFDEEGTITKPPYYNQGSTETFLTSRPPDDRPAFPGYYGPTPGYATFNVPTASEKDQVEEEETYTSPNDFVNFPPVRNPNLNMSATSSAVTYDLEVSTPAFVEDDILKDKMNLLVNKIVQSLQGNFHVLADIIEERNNTILQSDVDKTTLRPATTRRPATTTRFPQPTRTSTRRPAISNRPSLGPSRSTTVRPPGTRRPTQVTKKPVSTKKPATKPSPSVTKKPNTTRRPTKPTKRVPTTTELELEEEEENNEIETSGSTEASRRIQCGVRPRIKSGRIVGGKGAMFGEWPWQVLVRESTWLGLFTKNKCGGVLITNKFVITAAHCQPGFLASLVAVFGEFDISGDVEEKRAVTKNVKRVIVHRQYDAATFENDLALLELETAIHYDSHIVPICMPPDNADFTGRMATVTGWGRLKYGGGVPSVLQEVQVPIIENSVCQEMFHTAGHNKKILPSFLCAGYANGQKDSCEGDSGGPLVLQRDDGRWELAGTVSHGIKCAAPYLPGVYMRTTYYKPWLKSITGIK